MDKGGRQGASASAEELWGLLQGTTIHAQLYVHNYTYT